MFGATAVAIATVTPHIPVDLKRSSSPGWCKSTLWLISVSLIEHMGRMFLLESWLELQMLEYFPSGNAGLSNGIWRWYYVWWFNCISREYLFAIIFNIALLWKSYRCLWKIDVKTSNINVPVYFCYLYSFICIYSCNFLAFAGNTFVGTIWEMQRISIYIRSLFSETTLLQKNR